MSRVQRLRDHRASGTNKRFIYAISKDGKWYGRHFNPVLGNTFKSIMGHATKIEAIRYTVDWFRLYEDLEISQSRTLRCVNLSALKGSTLKMSS